MKPNISSINWPIASRDAVILLRYYMLAAVKRWDLKFTDDLFDPTDIVQGLLTGEISDGHRQAACDYWWSLIDELGIRDLGSRDALTARLAVCLLSPNEADTSSLGDQLSWFLEVLNMLGIDLRKEIGNLEKHFSFAKTP